MDIDFPGKAPRPCAADTAAHSSAAAPGKSATAPTEAAHQGTSPGTSEAGPAKDDGTAAAAGPAGPPPAAAPVGAAGPGQEEGGEGPGDPPAPRPQIPDHLARLLVSLVSSSAAPPPGPHHHQQPAPPPQQQQQPAPPPQQQQQQQQPLQSAVPSTRLLVLAVHAAMLETGFEALQDTADESASGAQPAALGGGAGGTYTLLYRLASAPRPAGLAAGAGGRPGENEGEGEEGGRGEGGAGGEGAADAAASASGSVKDPSAVVRCMEVGRHMVVAGSVAEGGGGGGGVVRAAPLHTLTLEIPRFCQPPDAGPSAGAGAGAGAEEAAWKLAARFSGLPDLWLRLRDGLALPLLAAACAAAGLAPPAGPLALPWELQESLLRLLPAKDLAMLSATCTQLRNLGSVDAIWRDLYEAEFPHPSASERTEGEARGWKRAFGLQWARRAARRRAAHRLLLPHTPQFHPGLAPWAPPAPGGGLLRPPFVIGGDYDRLPGGVGFMSGGGIGGGGIGGGGGPFVFPSGFSGGPLGPALGGGLPGRRGGGAGHWRMY